MYAATQQCSFMSHSPEMEKPTLAPKPALPKGKARGRVGERRLGYTGRGNVALFNRPSALLPGSGWEVSSAHISCSVCNHPEGRIEHVN